MKNLLRHNNKKAAYNRFRITDLTLGESDNDNDNDTGHYILCSLCDTSMTLADNDIYSPHDNLTVLVSKGQYYCKGCGLVKQDSPEPDTVNLVNTTKKQEQIGPVIAKRNRQEFVFKSIGYTPLRPAGRQRSEMEQYLEAEGDREIQRLKASGTIVGDSQTRMS